MIPLFVPHAIHHHLGVHRTSATNHIMIIPISNVINVCRIVGTILPALSPKPLEIYASSIQQSPTFHSIKAGIDVGYPSSIHVDIEQCVCLNHISKGIQDRLW